MVESLRAGQQALRDGDLVCIFPEGGLSRTGQIQGFQRGFVTVLRGTDAPVIPVSPGRTVGGAFSVSNGESSSGSGHSGVPYPVSIVFGRPMHGVKDQQEVRLEVEALGLSDHAEEQEGFHDSREDDVASVPQKTGSARRSPTRRARR